MRTYFQKNFRYKPYYNMYCHREQVHHHFGELCRNLNNVRRFTYNIECGRKLTALPSILDTGKSVFVLQADCLTSLNSHSITSTWNLEAVRERARTD
jgi:hypothetical protein